MKSWFRQDLSEYRIGAQLFCRGIGLIYLVALVSWWVQSDFLIGKNGLIPIQEWLDFLGKRISESGTGSRWEFPTLFWLTGGSDLAINLCFVIGCVLAVLVVVGIAQGPSLIGVWLIYLSFIVTGDTLMSFQWDILLQEAGFLSIFVSSWKWRESFRSPTPLSLRQMIAVGFVWFLIAKLMFLSGWVKLAWASEAQPEWWPEHTAMIFHYQTQPIPSWTSWYMHQLPEWFQKFSIWPMYFIELALPFFVVLGRGFRLLAALGFALLMFLILATGNYTYFNWLTIVICLPLVADCFWPKRIFKASAVKGISGYRKWLPFSISVPVFLILLLLNWQTLASSLNRAPKPLVKFDLSPGWLDGLAGKAYPFHLCSSYGLFRTMTIERPEIILEGSEDGITWRPYDFRWKPDALNERPRFVAPHQPRVAWQLWFAALEKQFHPRSRNARWFQAMVIQLLKGEKEVQKLFRENPFPDQPPKLIRARLFLYEFSNFEEKNASGNWWKRKEVGQYLPPIRLNP